MMSACFAPLRIILIIALMASGLMGAGARVTHALTMQGNTQIVICSTDGARLVTLDADGREIENSDANPHQNICTHCADCGLMPAVALIPPATEQPLGLVIVVTLVAEEVSPISEWTVRQSARGPPSKA